MINAFLLYPGRAVIHARSLNAIRSINENLDTWAPRMLPMAGLVLFPINSIHFLMAELWGTISVSFLLWGYVNVITPREAAKRYYAVLGLGAQLGPILGGLTVDALKAMDNFPKMLMWLNIISFVFMAIFAAGYFFMQRYVMKLPRFVIKQQDGAVNKKKAKMGIIESIKYCVTNPYVLALAGLVFAYGWCMVVGELSYKDVMKLATDGDSVRFSTMNGRESSGAAVVAMFLMTFVSHNVIRLFGWKITALLAPAICTLTSTIFYLSAIISKTYYEDPQEEGKFLVAQPAATISMWLGLLFCVATKATKYASFDPAKEMAYLPLTSEQKTKSKAAVDIVGARLGKGGAALFNIFVLNWIMAKEVTFERTTQLMSLTAVGVMMAIWIYSTLFLARAIKETQNENQLKETAIRPIKVEIKSHSEIETYGGGDTDISGELDAHSVDVEKTPTKED